MSTTPQVELFNKLLGEKDFGDLDLKELGKQFATLDGESASEWIQRAFDLPRVKGGGAGTKEAPPF